MCYLISLEIAPNKLQCTASSFEHTILKFRDKLNYQWICELVNSAWQFSWRLKSFDLRFVFEICEYTIFKSYHFSIRISIIVINFHIPSKHVIWKIRTWRTIYKYKVLIFKRWLSIQTSFNRWYLMNIT